MRRAALACLLILLLAGCGEPGQADGTRGPQADTSTDTGTTSPGGGNGTAPPIVENATAPSLVLADCTNHGGVFPVPMDAARAALPEGFEPVPTPSDPAGGATLYVLWLDCAGSAVDGNDTGATYVMYAELAVVPPADVQVPGVNDYTVPLAMGATTQAVGQRLEEFRLGHAGASTLTDVTTASPGPLQARMTVAGVDMQLTVQASPQQGNAFGAGSFALVGVQDGVVRTLVAGEAEGGAPSDAVATFQGDGLDLFDEARPVVRGFSVAGFTLTLTLVRSLA